MVVVQRIDYSLLEYPGPELAEAAIRGDVLSTFVTRDGKELSVATFAGGCFWGIELLFQRIEGVIYTYVGYSQGEEPYPIYPHVWSGSTGHAESVIVLYNNEECSYENLLDAFFGFVDPTTVEGQGGDSGPQYRTGVYHRSTEQEKCASERMVKEKTKYEKPIATELKAAMPFWPAEKGHQKFLSSGGRYGKAQDPSKGVTTKIRCYG